MGIIRGKHGGKRGWAGAAETSFGAHEALAAEPAAELEETAVGEETCAPGCNGQEADVECSDDDVDMGSAPSCEERGDEDQAGSCLPYCCFSDPAPPAPRPNVLETHRCPRGGTVFEGRHARFALLRGCLDPATLQWLRRDPDFPSGPEELKTRYRWQDASEKAKAYTNEYKVQVMGHTRDCARPRGRSLECNGLEASVPAPQRTRQWVQAFKRVNAVALDTLQSYLVEELGKLSEAEMGKNGQQLRDVHPAEWLFHFWMPQPMQTGAGRLDKKHVDGGASIVHLSLSLFGTRKLLFWEEGVAQPHVMILREGDVYISSPAAFEHQVLHQDDPASGEELLQFGGMGLVKLAIQLRCDTFALNRGRSPPASPKHALKAASEAVQRWLLKVPLALPTLEEAQAELV